MRVTALVRDDAQADILAARRLAGPWKDKSGDRSTVAGASGRHG